MINLRNAIKANALMGLDKHGLSKIEKFKASRLRADELGIDSDKNR